MYFFPMLKSRPDSPRPDRLIFDSVLKLESEEYPITQALSVAEAYVASCPPEANIRVELLSIEV